MYNPKGNGKTRKTPQVQFTEIEPSDGLRAIVHRFLILRTDAPLDADYRFHALPDACTYVVFNQRDVNITGISKLRAHSEEFNLGRDFHFINIRLLPGVWQGDEPISYGLLDTPYKGGLPLVDINTDLVHADEDHIVAILTDLVENLMANGLVTANPIVEKIFHNLDDIFSVNDMAEAAELSPRQLQRRLKTSTGFTPHDFLKVLRLQQTLGGGDISSYADQSHFIHSFRRATGYTPVKYSRKFDV